jgi:hypothetical protein
MRSRLGIDVKAIATFMLAVGLVFVAQSAVAQQFFQIVNKAVGVAFDGGDELAYDVDVTTDDGDRILVVFVQAENGDDGTGEVTADGVDMDLVPGTDVSEENSFVGAFYLLEADLPASGDIEIVVTIDPEADGTGIVSEAYVVQNAVQEEPFGDGSFEFGGDGGFIETEVTTEADLSLVLDGVHCGDGDDEDLSGDDFIPTGDGQVKQLAEAAASMVGAGSSILVEGADETVTPGWEIDSDNRNAHSIVLIAATAGSEPPPPLGANQGPTSVPSGAPVDGGFALALLVLGGALGGALAIRRGRK